MLSFFCHQLGQEDEDVEKVKMDHTSATHGEVTILTLTCGSNIKTNGMSTHACQQRTSQFFVKNESAEVVNMRSFVQLEGSMKASIIAFVVQKEV